MAKMETGKEESSVNSLGKTLQRVASEITSVRKQILQNEAVLKSKISAKACAEDLLRKILRKSFSSEKAALSRIKSSAAKKQASLKQKIVDLEKINKVYDEKKARINDAKRKQLALKKQIKMLEKQAGGW